jgi:integrative and conjugative element protein (TIGR02256 family)
VIGFVFDGTDVQLVFSSRVVSHFKRHQQLLLRQAEAGGQLFARLTRYEIFVEEATGPRSGDVRSRLSYIPNRTLERKEIGEKFGIGLHYVGDWHTHPEETPSPSRVDQVTMADCSRRSIHMLNGFLLAIVGNGAFPACLHISFYPRRYPSNGPIALKATPPTEGRHFLAPKN